MPLLLYEGARELDTPSAAGAARAAQPAGSAGAALFERWYAYLQCAGNAYLEAVSLAARCASCMCCGPTA